MTRSSFGCEPRARDAELLKKGFDRGRVLEGVIGTRFQGSVWHVAITSSTSTLAMEAASAGAADGVWVADEQTAGRGRGGRPWHSAAGDGLYMSALVRPNLPMAEAMILPLAVGLAAQGAVEEVTGLAADLRWPNDLLLGGSLVGGRRMKARKCGGILLETGGVDEVGRMRYAVIGVGINTNHPLFPEELRGVATSLRLEGGGAEVSREQVLAALLRRLDGELRTLEERDGVAEVVRRFTAASSWVAGRSVRVGEAADSYTGVTRGLTAHGFLRVAGTDGVERTVLSGGVREWVEAPMLEHQMQAGQRQQ